MSLRTAEHGLQEVLVSIYHKTCGDWLQTYSGIESDTGLSNKDVRTYVGIAKKLGYVKVSTGVDDEGLFAGKGFYLVNEKTAEIDLLDEIIELRSKAIEQIGKGE